MHFFVPGTLLFFVLFVFARHRPGKKYAAINKIICIYVEFSGSALSRPELHRKKKSPF